jgi:hypothetical protein
MRIELKAIGFPDHMHEASIKLGSVVAAVQMYLDDAPVLVADNLAVFETDVITAIPLADELVLIKRENIPQHIPVCSRLIDRATKLSCHRAMMRPNGPEVVVHLGDHCVSPSQDPPPHLELAAREFEIRAHELAAGWQKDAYSTAALVLRAERFVEQDRKKAKQFASLVRIGADATMRCRARIVFARSLCEADQRFDPLSILGKIPGMAINSDDRYLGLLAFLWRVRIRETLTRSKVLSRESRQDLEEAFSLFLPFHERSQWCEDTSPVQQVAAWLNEHYGDENLVHTLHHRMGLFKSPY